MNRFLKTVGIVTLAVIATAVAAFFLTRRYAPRVVTQTDTQYVDRYITRRDTVTVERPTIRTVYRTRTDTVRVEVLVPADFAIRGVIAAHPIRFNRGDVVLTYFADSSFVQDRYRIPRPAWGYSISVFAAYAPISRSPVMGMEAVLRWRTLSLYARQGYSEAGMRTTVGIKYRIRGVE